MIALILFFLLSRIAIDILWPSSKPAVAVAYYTFFGILISLYFLSKSKSKSKTRHLLIPLVAFLFPCTLMVSQLNSSVPFFEHVKFALQVFIPCLFLVSITNIPTTMSQASLIYKKYFSIAVLFFLLIASYFSYKAEGQPGIGFYQHYQNAPNHVLAQTLLKSALPLVTSGTVWVIASFLLIFIFNVRSVMLAYLMSLAFTHKDFFLKKKQIKKFFLFLAPLLMFASLQIDWLEIYERVVFKGRNIDSTDALDVASSGRTYIYQMYITHIVNNFGFKEWLFGVGPLWLQDGGPTLSAHNDALNLLISFGLLGLLGTLLCYLYFYIKLPDTGKIIFGASFIALFLTNGLVFHQSTILFSLLYFFQKNKIHYRIDNSN